MHPGIQIEFVPGADLPKSGNPRLYGCSLPMPCHQRWRHPAGAPAFFEPPQVGRGQGSRSHQVHLSPQDVDELRKFVQAEPPEGTTDGGDARVVGNLEHRRGRRRRNRRPHPFGAFPHRPELQHPKGSVVLSDSLLAKQHGTGRIQLHQNCHDQQQGREKNQQSGRGDELDGPAQSLRVGSIPGRLRAGEKLLISQWSRSRFRQAIRLATPTGACTRTPGKRHGRRRRAPPIGQGRSPEVSAAR